MSSNKVLNQAYNADDNFYFKNTLL